MGALVLPTGGHRRTMEAGTSRDNEKGVTNMSPNGRGPSRTVWIVVAAVVVLAVIIFVVLQAGGGGGGGGGGGY